MGVSLSFHKKVIKMGICAPGSSSCFTAKRDEARPVFTIVALPDISAGINYCLTNTPNGQPSAISAVPCTSADVAKPSLLFTNVPHSSKNYTFQYISKLDNQCIYYHSNTKFGLTFCNSQDPSQVCLNVLLKWNPFINIIKSIKPITNTHHQIHQSNH